MRPQLEIIEKIDAYILGKLSKNDAQIIANEIQQSAELQEIYATQQLIQQAVMRKAILFQVQQFAPTISPATTFWTKFKWPIILSSVLIALLGLAAINYFSQDSSEKIGSTENNLQLWRQHQRTIQKSMLIPSNVWMKQRSHLSNL